MNGKEHYKEAEPHAVRAMHRVLTVLGVLVSWFVIEVMVTIVADQFVGTDYRPVKWLLFPVSVGLTALWYRFLNRVRAF